MPTYAYRCKDCDHAFDVVQAFTDDSLTQCPECDGTLRKQYGSVGVTFKGSGFYRTDSRSRSTSSGSGAGASGSSDGASSAASSTGSSTGSSSGATSPSAGAAG